MNTSFVIVRAQAEEAAALLEYLKIIGVEIGPRFGNVHVAIFGKRSREAERMIFLQRISGIQVKTHREALGLVLYVVVTP